MTEKYAKMLDTILQYMSDTEIKGQIAVRDVDTWFPILGELEKRGTLIFPHEFSRCMEYLKENNFIFMGEPTVATEEVPSHVNLQIRFKGLDIISKENGGFTQLRLNQLHDKRYARRNERLLRGYTLWLMIGTIGLVVVELIIHYDVIWQNLKHIFLCG
jgi:hypothetical protein